MVVESSEPFALQEFGSLTFALLLWNKEIVSSSGSQFKVRSSDLSRLQTKGMVCGSSVRSRIFLAEVSCNRNNLNFYTKTIILYLDTVH